MAELRRDRTRAAKLRLQKAAGKITPGNLAWLDAYDTRVTIARAKNLPSASATAYKATTRPKVAPSPVTPPAPVVRGPHLVLAFDAHAPTGAHQTAPPAGTLAPETYTWTPITPPAPPEAEAPPPGAPQPPPAGTPLVDDAPSSARPPGDPAAAKQVAALCAFITRFGIQAALELAADAPVPPELRQLAENPQTHMEALSIVYGAAERLALKWGVQSIPLADEVLVVGAVGGSIMAVLAQQKRKRMPGRAAPPPRTVAAPAQPARASDGDSDDPSVMFHSTTKAGAL